jgi:hypothetical protein
MNPSRLIRMAAALLLACTAALSGAAAAQETTERGGKGLWYWTGNVAATDFKHGITLNVYFIPESNCDDALFVLAGNDRVTSMTFTIDGESYNSVAVDRSSIDGLPVAGFVLSDAALYDLKHGYHLTLDTNVGRLGVGLSGSAMAFNNAYGNCMYQIAPPTLQATPPRQRQPQADLRPGTALGGDKLSSFETDSGATLLFFEGEFERDDGRRIIEALRTTGAPLLILTSEGGLVSEAQMVGYYLRSNNVNALASGLCASACTFALAGGVERGAIEDTRIGVHRASLLGGGGSLEDGQQLLANYLRYFRSMDVDPEIVAMAGSVASERMHWLSLDEAIELGLIQETVSLDE